MNDMPSHLSKLDKLALLHAAQYLLGKNLPIISAEWEMFKIANGHFVDFCRTLLIDGANKPELVG